MKTLSSNIQGFTLIELLVVIFIIALLAALALPALSNAQRQGQMMQTMSNGRQLQMAVQSMTFDNLAAGGPYNWTASNAVALPGGLNAFTNLLISGGYLTTNEVVRLFKAPGTSSAWKVYAVCDADPADSILFATANFNGTNSLPSNIPPYGQHGVVIIHKGGDALILKGSQLVNLASSSNVGEIATNAGGGGILP